MPSLPPDLNPWMMRPRAGQRNSGSVPAASACAPVSGVFDCDAPDSRLPVGVLSIAGFFASDDLDGSASATASPLDVFGVLRLQTSPPPWRPCQPWLWLFFFFVLLLVLRLLGLGDIGVGDVRIVLLFRPSPYRRWRRHGRRRDRRAPQGASRSSHQRRSTGHWRREAQKPARRSGLEIVSRVSPLPTTIGEPPEAVQPTADPPTACGFDSEAVCVPDAAGAACASGDVVTPDVGAA